MMPGYIPGTYTAKVKIFSQITPPQLLNKVNTITLSPPKAKGPVGAVRILSHRKHPIRGAAVVKNNQKKP